MRPASVHARDLTPGQTRVSLAIIAVLFFIFGFVSWANAILIPYFKIACELTHFEAYLVTFAFYISYLCSRGRPEACCAGPGSSAG